MTHMEVYNDVYCRSYCEVAPGSFVMDAPNLKRERSHQYQRTDYKIESKIVHNH